MIKIQGLTKIYASGTQAVNNLDMEVADGEIFALLGPNGAGKSTTIRILTTLAGFDEGKVSVAEFDIDRDPDKVRQSIGYVAQETGVDYFLTGRENMELQGHLYRMPTAEIKQRIEELASYFELSEHLDQQVFGYSGGMRRKLDIATALIHRPKLLFLDEPTLGLDIQSRKSLWQYIERLNQEFGLTILLTTHYLDEADKLANRVAIINHGQIKVTDTPAALKQSLSGDVVSLAMESDGKEEALTWALKQADFVKGSTWEGDKLHLYVDNGPQAIPHVMEVATSQNAKVTQISFSQPTLDDVFIKYTGSSITGEQEEEGEKWWEKWAGKGGGGKWAKKWQQENQEAPTEEETAGAGDEDWKASSQEWQQWQQKKQQAPGSEQEKETAAGEEQSWPNQWNQGEGNQENWQQWQQKSGKDENKKEQQPWPDKQDWNQADDTNKKD